MEQLWRGTMDMLRAVLFLLGVIGLGVSAVILAVLVLESLGLITFIRPRPIAIIAVVSIFLIFAAFRFKRHKK